MAASPSVITAASDSRKPDRQLLLQQFARAPVPGRVKTRMQPHLSPQQACELHCELVTWCCSTLLSSGLGPVELWVSDGTDASVFNDCLGAGASAIIEQRGADLGQRMLHALRDGLSRHARVVLVGSDCPAINPAYLAMADKALYNAGLVLGPAQDGGFVLIGASSPSVISDAVFEGVAWGAESVYAKTAENLCALGLRWEVLPTLPDIDRPEDLPLWRALQGTTW